MSEITRGLSDTRAARSEHAVDLPHKGARPEGELQELNRVWVLPSGWRILSAVNNTYVGLWYIGTALLFFVLAGILALVMRTQLAQPGLRLVGHELYNQLFTMHGTMMMFLFAVPMVEAFGVFLLPSLQAARDLPFPRLSAYAFWAYMIGGLAFFCSLFFGLAPNGGWFMYPPLTSYEYSPGINADFWLLGIGFIEISAIAGAIEIIVGVMKTRAPGQSLDKLPVYAWAMLVFAFLIVFAFPAIIVATLLLELERAFHWPFFVAARGGDPLLWQHLFWFFGHPEVYVIFLPAAGMVSMMVPAMAQTPLAAYRLVVLAIVSTGFLSFGLWVHHMFTTGIPALSISFFSAASMAVAIPSGIQIFAWIATIASGRLQMRTPTYFVLGFFFIFTLGGLTGVMVAMVPFDFQAHDTYFIVAHLHYVLIGGMVFPIFAAFYYWAPTASTRPLSERLGKTAFWLMFIGVNVTFFTMHITGLMGMPRRTYTYIPEMGWGTLNAISTGGAFLIGAGVLVFLIDLAMNFRPGQRGDSGNPWNAGTLEWLPSGNYQTRSIPIVTSREPLWDQPHLARDVADGRYYLPGTQTGGRETIVTSPIEAVPQYVLPIPGPSWLTLLAALFTAAFFLGLTVQIYIPAFLCGAVAIVLVLWWMWDTDPGPIHGDVDIGGGLVLPTYVTGPMNHSWWAVIVLLMVAGACFLCLVVSYFYLWTVNVANWPPPGGSRPGALPVVGSALLYATGSLTIFVAGRLLKGTPERNVWRVRGLIILAVSALVAACGFEVGGWLAAGLRPDESSFAAMVFAIGAWQGFFTAVLSIMALFTLARSFAGRLSARQRVTFDNLQLLWHYATAQGLCALLLLHG